MVWGLVQTGETKLAEEAAADLREDFDKLAAAIIEGDWGLAAMALISNAEGDQGAALEWLRKAYERGLRDLRVFREPALASLAENPEFRSIRAEIARELEREHGEMRLLVCFNNPVPDTWQPLTETCEGVVRQI